MNKQELLSLAARCGSISQLIKKLQVETNTATREATATLFNSLLTQHNLTKKQIVANFNKHMRANYLASKGK